MKLHNKFSTTLIFIITFIFLWVVFAHAKSSKKGFIVPVLSTTHKFKPGKNCNLKLASMMSHLLKLEKTNSKPVIHLGKKYIAKHRPKSIRPKKPISSRRFRRKLSARSAIIIDAADGKVLYSHKPDRPGQPASTIKVLTGLIAIKSLVKTEPVPVSWRAARMPSSKIWLKPGKSYPANDLINAVLLSSANDASVALAEKIAGSEKTFAKLMTHKAKSMGARTTICKTATGLTRRGQQSTVRDLALIFKKAMEDRQFAKKIGKVRARTSEGKLLRNHNKALWRVVGAQGGKTGYTNAARQTYVGKFVRDDYQLVVAIMGSETMWSDIKNLVEHGFNKKVFIVGQKKQENITPVIQLSSNKAVKNLNSFSPSQLEPVKFLSGTSKHKRSL
jgi:serine-type D-Ala-D-Ala carboxypeptidase (penicillin-binding protein 5/6)